MMMDDTAEDYGLFNPTVRRRGFLNRIIQQSRWNPIFYSSILFCILSTFALIIHALWAFAFGIGLSVTSILLGVTCIYICVTGRYRKPWSYLSRKEVTKILTFGFFCLSLQLVLVWGHSTLLGTHFNGADPHWPSFPSSCTPPPSNNPDSPSNCVRVGINIANPDGTPGIEPIAPPKYEKQTPEVIFKAFNKAASEKMGCRALFVTDDDTGWAHYRCITPFLGKASDIAFQVTDENIYTTKAAERNSSYISPWIHSQARHVDNGWDNNTNDAYVRLLLALVFRDLPDV